MCFFFLRSDLNTFHLESCGKIKCVIWILMELTSHSYYLFWQTHKLDQVAALSGIIFWELLPISNQVLLKHFYFLTHGENNNICFIYGLPGPSKQHQWLVGYI